MTYKEQADTITIEISRVERERIGEVLGWAIGEAMENHNYPMASKIATLVREMNAPMDVYRMYTEWGI